MAQQRGTISWFSNAKGFGFISHDDETDVFCYFSVIHVEGHKNLKEGDVVEFEIIQGDKGPQADLIKLVAAAP